MSTSALAFESCVVLDGDKTGMDAVWIDTRFESCVVLDGDKTFPRFKSRKRCLRVVLF